MIDNRDARTQMRESYWVFKQVLWREMGWDRYHKLGWVDELMAEQVQHGPRLQGILANRGYGKTHDIYAETIWKWLNDPNEKVIGISKSLGHGRKMLKKLRNIIDQVAWLNHLQ